MKKIELEIPEGKEAKWVNGVLTLVDEQPQDIIECIKTFEDACEWCNENCKGYLVSNYEEFTITYSAGHIAAADILAYLKLRIITCALNEGWEPTFEDVERRWYCYYDCDHELRVVASFESSTVHYPKMLFFKSEVLAEYAAKQFKDIYIEFCYKSK